MWLIVRKYVSVIPKLQNPTVSVIIEDTLGMFKEFISSQTVRKNYYPPDNNIESD